MKDVRAEATLENLQRFGGFLAFKAKPQAQDVIFLPAFCAYASISLAIYPYRSIVSG